MRVLLIDNYDSFTFNLVHIIEPLVNELVVWRNDEFNIESVASFDKIIFSPGPSLPEEAGLMMEVIHRFSESKPMFGVCLGFQAIIEHFGGELENFDPVRHGEPKIMRVFNKASIFRNLGNSEKVGLYHSWGIRTANLPKCFINLGADDDGVVLAIKHQSLPLYGVQFHPESIMTTNGNTIIENWIKS